MELFLVNDMQTLLPPLSPSSPRNGQKVYAYISDDFKERKKLLPEKKFDKCYFRLKLSKTYAKKCHQNQTKKNGRGHFPGPHTVWIEFP